MQSLVCGGFFFFGGGKGATGSPNKDVASENFSSSV